MFFSRIVCSQCSADMLGICPAVFFVYIFFMHIIWQPRSIEPWNVFVPYFLFLTLISCCGFKSGKPRGRQPKVPKHTVDSGGVINISDDSSSDSDGMDTDSNSSPDSLLDNDDVIFVNQTSYQTGREALDIFWLFQKCRYDTDTCLDSGITFHSVADTVASHALLFLWLLPIRVTRLMSALLPIHSQDRGDEAGPPQQNIRTGKRTTSQYPGRAHW